MNEWISILLGDYVFEWWHIFVYFGLTCVSYMCACVLNSAFEL